MKTSLLTFTIIFFSLAYCYGQITDIQIKEAVWTNEVNAQKHYVTKYEDIAPLGDLVIWMNISGSKKTWEELKSNSKIPIRYKWFKKTGITWLPKGNLVPVDKLNMADSALVKSLEQELANNGSFVWNTWCVKDQDRVRKGTWKVNVVNSTNRKLGEYKIVVR